MAIDLCLLVRIDKLVSRWILSTPELAVFFHPCCCALTTLLGEDYFPLLVQLFNGRKEVQDPFHLLGTY